MSNRLGRLSRLYRFVPSTLRLHPQLTPFVVRRKVALGHFFFLGGHLTPWVPVEIIARPALQDGAVIGRTHQMLEDANSGTDTQERMLRQMDGNISLNTNRQWSDLTIVAWERQRPAVTQEFYKFTPGLSLSFFFTVSLWEGQSPRL